MNTNIYMEVMKGDARLTIQGRIELLAQLLQTFVDLEKQKEAVVNNLLQIKTTKTSSKNNQP